MNDILTKICIIARKLDRRKEIKIWGTASKTDFCRKPRIEAISNAMKSV